MYHLGEKIKYNKLHVANDIVWESLKISHENTKDFANIVLK